MTFDQNGNPLTVFDFDPSKLPVNKKINPFYKFIDGEIEPEEEEEVEADAVNNLKMAAKNKRDILNKSKTTKNPKE